MKSLLIYIMVLFSGLHMFAQEQKDENRFIATQKVNKLLEKRSDCAVKNKTSIKFYHIQLYNGQNIDKARAVKSKFLENFPGTYAIVEWESPEFKVWVGEYENKLSADQALLKIRKIYPNAFIVNPKD